MNDPRNANARAKGATNGENQNIDWRDVARYPVLYEQKIGGVTVDVRAPAIRTEAGSIVHSMPLFELSQMNESDVWRWDRQLGTKTFVTRLPKKSSEARWLYKATA